MPWLPSWVFAVGLGVLAALLCKCCACPARDAASTTVSPYCGPLFERRAPLATRPPGLVHAARVAAQVQHLVGLKCQEQAAPLSVSVCTGHDAVCAVAMLALCSTEAAVATQ